MESIMNRNEIYESSNRHHENTFLDQLNNADKIIHRGQINKEVQGFAHNATETNNKFLNFSYSNNKIFTIYSTLLYSVMILSIGYFISQYFSKNINLVSFVTFMSILTLYRDRISQSTSVIPEFIDAFGRIDSIYKNISFIDNLSNIPKYSSNMSVPFSEIKFDNVSFKYEGSDIPIFYNINVSLTTTGSKIIGMNGNSGRGKSTFVKLILKIYKLQSGDIYIDNVNIKDIDPDYLRENIVYINQSGKLFDKIIADNMLYACDDEICKERLSEIMSYEKIHSLFKNVDINSSLAGSLGENLSGGQRQVVNIINGLIHPSKIMILDEPTNVLDGELKHDIIQLIRDFKKYKQCIFVITHDSDMDPIFDEVLKL
jgi:ABC-type multidrug transport system fused ATPase/permease subunit